VAELLERLKSALADRHTIERELGSEDVEAVYCPQVSGDHETP
jgi:hypothetical protein